MNGYTPWLEGTIVPGLIPLSLDVRLDACGTCIRCCNGSHFTLALVPVDEIIAAARWFPVVFKKVDGAFLPVMIYALEMGNACLYLDGKTGQCRIYHQGRPSACTNFPFRLSLATPPIDQAEQKFAGVVEVDGRCPALRQDGSGSVLMDETGRLTTGFLQTLIIPRESDFLERTIPFGRQLDYLNLLKKRRVKTKKGRAKQGMQTFWSVSRKRFRKLARSDQWRLGESGFLALVEAHLASCRHLARLMDRNNG